MKLYVADRAPGPNVARRLVAFKNASVEEVVIDIQNADNRKADFLKINPAGQVPCLQTDNGIVISEVTAIAEYLEELIPDPIFVGATAEERAETRMWMRRADLMVISTMGVGFQHGKGAPFFEGRIPIYTDVSAPMISIAQHGLRWFNDQLATRTYLCGDRFTYADIVLHGFATFFAKLGQNFDPELSHLIAYMERVGAHPSVAAI